MLRIKRLVTMSLCLLVVYLGAGTGFAQQGGSGLAVYTTRTELSLLPGEQKDFKIPIKNTTQGPITVKVFVNNFMSDGVTGQPRIITDDSEPNPNSVKNFVREVKDFALSAGEQKEVEFTVDVPNDASPGGYYGVIRFAAVPQGEDSESNSQTQVSLNASVAPHLFVNVAGDITKQIQIDGVKVFRDKRTFPIFFVEPNKVEASISNKGNGFSRPIGNIQIKRGATEVYLYELNSTEPRGTILPNTSRTFTDEIKNVNKFGKYTVYASVAYEQGGEVIVRQASFWYIPIWMAAVALAAVITLVIVSWLIYRRLGKKRRRR